MPDDRPTMQSQPRLDPSAREGIKRLLATHDDEARMRLIRDSLRAVDRPAAVSILNEHLLGLRVPASSDRGRMTALLRDLLRARRPDAYECLQSLTSYELESKLDDPQYDAYSEAVDKLNDAAEGGRAKGIAGAAADVIAAMRAGLDEDAVRRHVILHALPETIDTLLGALGGEVPAAGKTKSRTPPNRDTKTPARKATSSRTKTAAASKQVGAGRAKPAAGAAGKKRAPAATGTTGKRGGAAGGARRKSTGRSSKSGG